ncbi:hypothetical protein ACFMQL_20130 [Nonomuraea fastidiosa]|uniref:hypothetical protein n=1 Tax=Nonomuraea fastidiosa TaxID=46173 RepID=UPI003671FA89
MRDQLVATGDGTVDAYLAMARDMRHFQRVLEDAEQALVEAKQRELRHNGLRGTSAARLGAEEAYRDAKQMLDLACRDEDLAEAAALAAAPHLAQRVTAEVEALWSDFYGPRDTRDWREEPMPDDPTTWDELETGAEVHIRYETKDSTLVWKFAGLGEPHPENPDLRIARCIEHSPLRPHGGLVELAVHPNDRVGTHARSPHMKIIRKEQQV